MTEPVPSPALQTFDLSKTYGGLVAVQSVNLAVTRGELHALIGPNGAGKSTLLDLLSGVTPPSAGRVALLGRDITGIKPHRAAALGLGRSFQRASVLPGLTCLENAWLGARAKRGGFALFDGAHAGGETRERALSALTRLGLDARAATPAHAISHGEQRQLEIAMMLAAEPQVLLLDEPLAGLGAEESAKMAQLIKSLAGAHTLVLVEHDMDAVFAIADRVTVLVEGRILETGAPAAIRASRQVQAAYLGEEGAP